MANGGDGYPNFASRMATLDLMDQVVADYITAQHADQSRRSRAGSRAPEPAARW